MRIKAGEIYGYFPDARKFVDELDDFEIEVDPAHLEECERLHQGLPLGARQALAAYHTHTLDKGKVSNFAKLPTPEAKVATLLEQHLTHMQGETEFRHERRRVFQTLQVTLDNILESVGRIERDVKDLVGVIYREESETREKLEDIAATIRMETQRQTKDIIDSAPPLIPNWVVILWAVIVAILLGAITARGQGPNVDIRRLNGSTINTHPFGAGVSTVVSFETSSVHITCDGGCGGAAAFTDNAAFTAGTTSTTPVAGFYHNVRDTVTNGSAATVAITSNRALITSLEDVNKIALVYTAGGAVTVGFTTPNIAENITQLNGTVPALHSFGGGVSLVVSFETGNIGVSVNNTPAVTISGQPVNVQFLTGTINVQGTQGVSGNAVVIGFQTGNIATNVTQLGGTAIATASYAAGAAVVIGFQTASIGVTAVEGTAASMANGWTVAVGMSSGGTNTALITDPCETSIGIFLSGSITTSTTIVTGTSAKFISICSFDIYVTPATNWALVEGTGTLCATNLAANYMGGTTAATGPNFVANQGLVAGDGRHARYTQTRAADNLCLLLSGSSQVNYNLKYVVP